MTQQRLTRSDEIRPCRDDIGAMEGYNTQQVEDILRRYLRGAELGEVATATHLPVEMVRQVVTGGGASTPLHPCPNCVCTHLIGNRTAISLRNQANEQADSLATAHRHGARWTETELAVLDGPLSARAAAALLGRSYYTVRERRRLMRKQARAEVDTDA